MTYTCPHCHKQHRLHAGVVPPPNAAARCKQCGHRFLLTTAESPTPEAPRLQSETILHTDQATSMATAKEDPSGTDQERNDNVSAIVAAFPELRELPQGQFHWEEIFHTATPRYQTRANRLLARVVVAAASLLREKLLRPNETVRKVASGIAYFPFEIPYANGLLTGPLNNYALVATDHRLLFINLDYRLTRPDRYVFQVPYKEIAKVSRGFYGSSLVVETFTGRTWDFTTINRSLAIGLERFIKEQMAPMDDAPPAHPQLCPACYKPVPPNMTSCPRCLTPYKSATIAIKKSLLLPGTGNLYLSYTSLGIAEIIGYFFTWLLTIALVIIGIPGGILGGGLLVLSYHFMTAFMAGQMARKGYLAEERYLDELIAAPDEPAG